MADYTQEDLQERSPFLTRLIKRRLAPSRLNDLLTAARSSRPPKEPDPSDCCGSSCSPCVKELWREEKKVWEEVHPDGPESEDEEEDEVEEKGKPQVEIALEEGLEKIAVDGKTQPAKENKEAGGAEDA